MKIKYQNNLLTLLLILSVIFTISCNNKKEEWIKIRGTVFVNDNGFEKIIKSPADEKNKSFDELVDEYSPGGSYLNPLINITYQNDNTKIFKAKFEEGGEIYLVTKNPDYKMGGKTSRFSHLITVNSKITVYLQLDL
jgi:hypothetical protein